MADWLFRHCCREPVRIEREALVGARLVLVGDWCAAGTSRMRLGLLSLLVPSETMHRILDPVIWYRSSDDTPSIGLNGGDLLGSSKDWKQRLGRILRGDLAVELNGTNDRCTTWMLRTVERGPSSSVTLIPDATVAYVKCRLNASADWQVWP